MQAKDSDTTTMRGREAEERAARHLERCGQRIVERNFRVRGGEIDLICRDGRTMDFVEARSRRARASACWCKVRRRLANTGKQRRLPSPFRPNIL